MAKHVSTRRAWCAAAIALLAATAIADSMRASAAIASGAPAVPADIRAALIEADGIEVGDTALSQSTIAADQALTIAGEKFGWARGGPRKAYLGTFTDPHYGLTAEGQGPIAPYFVDRRAWIVVTPDTVHQYYGRHWPGRTFKATLVSFLDADTGAFLEAITLRP